ncbi:MULTISPECIES: hypothetical protein [Flavobacterium]|uniref:hypothetical protein n=1 Tax=Flavobacterium TaxID=237 RepID=UPI000C54ECCB|nr:MULTISPECIES: hypothetical protein [Flavobacterium]MBF00657.1 hypothetical protein [Flavobacterium sp.]MBY8963821.1 hypothetical protein [Flavobacterium coralii]|tara:strand:- start:28024 stop:28470 length:447 start_codon:yes stop_codon:yes gene_type:complete
MDAYQSVLALHSYWAFATLGLLLIALLNSFAGLSAKRPFLKRDRQIALIALTFTHIQFLLGMVLYFLSPKLEAAKAAGMGAVMKDSNLRLFVVEHPLTNIIAVILITIGWSGHKKAAESPAKFKRLAYLYALGFILLLSRIPWSQWLN